MQSGTADPTLTFIIERNLIESWVDFLDSSYCLASLAKELEITCRPPHAWWSVTRRGDQMMSVIDELVIRNCLNFDLKSQLGGLYRRWRYDDCRCCWGQSPERYWGPLADIIRKEIPEPNWAMVLPLPRHLRYL
jgi:hypothetical protein